VGALALCKADRGDRPELAADGNMEGLI
jgi:hypothetical protein